MKQHDWISKPLKIVANEAGRQGSNFGVDELIAVIETYAAEVSSNEVEQIYVLEHMVAKVGPLHRKGAGKIGLHFEKSRIAS